MQEGNDAPAVLIYTPSNVERKIAEAHLVKNTVPANVVVDLTGQTGEPTMTMREAETCPARDFFNQWTGILGNGKVGEDDASS